MQNIGIERPLFIAEAKCNFNTMVKLYEYFKCCLSGIPFINMNFPSSENVDPVACCSSSTTPPMTVLTTNDYLDGLHCLHEAQKANATTEEIIFKLRLYLEDKLGSQYILNTILTLIKTQHIIDFSNHKEFEYCTSLLPLFMVLICLENSLR